MDTPIIVLIFAAIVVIAAVIAWTVVRKKRSEELRRRFGSEYDHAIQSAGNRATAEADLLARTKRVKALEIRPLSPADAARFTERWRRVQASFVDNPSGAVAEADQLVDEVMRVRGYPVVDFEQRAADLSVDHPQFVPNYRDARTIALASQRGTARTEDLRRATLHYRELFEDLLETAVRNTVEVPR